MSITVDFYKFSKKLNSTKQPQSASKSMNCTLKDVCSIESPILMISLGSVSAPEWNFCYIADFKRYYHIDNWTWIRGLWQASCSVDVLASYKTQIGNSTQYILRSSSEYDTYVIDSLYPTKAVNTITNVISTEEEAGNPAFVSTIAQGQFIFGIKGPSVEKVKSVGGINYYCLSYMQARQLMSFINSESFIESLAVSIVDPLSYIVSCQWLPFKVAAERDNNIITQIGFGCKYIDLQSYELPQSDNNLKLISQHFNLPQHPQIDRGKYLATSPYTRYTLIIGSIATIPIDTQALIDSNEIRVDYVIEYLSGNARIEIWSNNVLISKNTIPFSASIQLTQTTINLDSILSSTLSLLATAGSIGVGNLAGAIAGVTQGIKSGIESTFPQMHTIGSNNNLSIGNDRYLLKVEHSTLVDENREHLGRPLCKERVINTLSGYIKCSDADLDIDIPISELNALKNFMEGGFFYE